MFNRLYIVRRCVIVFLLAWLLILSWASQSPRLLLIDFAPNFGQFSVLPSLIVSMLRVSIGTIAALAFGIGIAILLRLAGERSVSAALSPVFAIAVTPAPIWITIAIILFGLTELLSIFVVFVSSTFFVLGITIFHLTQIPKRTFFLSRLFKHNAWETVMWAMWPELKTSAMGTARIALLVGWSSVIVSESAGAQSGLGAMLVFGRQLFDWPVVLASWITILVGTFITDSLAVKFLTEASSDT